MKLNSLFFFFFLQLLVMSLVVCVKLLLLPFVFYLEAYCCCLPFALFFDCFLKVSASLSSFDSVLNPFPPKLVPRPQVIAFSLFHGYSPIPFFAAFFIGART